MALINRPLTEDEARKILEDWRRTPAGLVRSEFWDLLLQAMNEPTPHVVRYNAFYSKRTYTPPKEFYWNYPLKRSPSDCVWIVPGTLERKID